MEATSRRRSERVVLGLLVLAYGSIYLCRANVEPGFNLLAVKYGYDTEALGAVFGIALAAYAVGKLVLGALGDVIGGKRILLLSMGGAVVASLLLGAVEWPARLGARTALLVMACFVVLNRFAQSGAWGGLVHIVARWFPPERSGTVMGIASTSYDIGNVVALLLASALVQAGQGFRAVFLVSSMLLGVVTLVVAFALRGAPSAAEATPAERASPEEPKETTTVLLARLARARGFWVAVVLSFLLTFVRAAFMTWTPTYLYAVATAAGSASALSSSIAKSAFFGVAGMAGSLVVGRLSDRWGPGQRAGVMTLSLSLLVIAVLALGHAHVTDPRGAAALVGVAGFFLLGPYSLLAGAITLDVAGKRGAATTAGIVDGVGYVGASLAAVVLGSVAKRLGWSAVFDVIAAVTVTSLGVAGGWWLGRSMKREVNEMAKAGLVYTVTDRSLLLPHYKRFIVDPLVAWIPVRVSPNVITHVGHLVNLCGVLVLLAFGRSGRAWPLYAAMVCLNVYNFCDNADGAHARRTKQTSAMGELLDHGLDMLNTTYIAFAAAVAVDAPPAWWVAIALVVPAACATTYWEQAETGHFSLGLLNQIESVFLLSFVLLGSAIFGHDVWHRIRLGSATLGVGIMSFVCAAAVLGMLHNVWRVVRTKRTATVLRVLPLFVFESGALVAAAVGILSPIAAVVIGTAGNVFFGVRCLAVRTAKDRPRHETGVIVSGSLVLAALAWGFTGHDGSHLLDVASSIAASLFFGAYTLLNACAARREVQRRDEEARLLAPGAHA